VSTADFPETKRARRTATFKQQQRLDATALDVAEMTVAAATTLSTTATEATATTPVIKIADGNAGKTRLSKCITIN